MADALIKLDVDHEGHKLALWQEGPGGIPLLKDLDLGEWLGFNRPRKIRELIDRYRPSLGEVSPYRGAKPSSPTGGRPEEGYLLTEEQALFIAAKSDTPKATAVLKMIVRVFMAVMRGEAPAPRIAPLALPAPSPGPRALHLGTRLIDVTLGDLLQEVERVAVRAAEQVHQSPMDKMTLTSPEVADRLYSSVPDREKRQIRFSSWWRRHPDITAKASRGTGRMMRWSWDLLMEALVYDPKAAQRGAVARVAAAARRAHAGT